jgi:hypothetical protein
MAEYPPDEWLVEQILPTAEFHIIGGPSGGGKTTLIMQLMVEWAAGRPIFGYTSHPRPFAYVSLDRGERSLIRTLHRCGVDPATFPYVCPRKRKKPIVGFEDLVYNFVVPKYHGVSVLVIEGITTLMTGNSKANDYNAAFKFFGDIAAWCNEEDITVIGVMHSPKMRESERYLNPRQRLLHSVAIGAIAETIILSEPSFESPVKLDRIVTVLPRNAPEQEFRMRLDEHGMHQPATDPEITKAMGEDAKASEMLDLWLKPKEPGCEFKSGDLVDEMKPLGIGRSTVFSWLLQAQEDHCIEPVKHGWYRKVSHSKL